MRPLLVAFDRPEPVVVVLPLLPIRRDVLVAAADEVPPHHQLLGKRWAAEQQDARGALAAVDEVQPITTGGLEREVGDVERGARDLDAALIEQHAVLEGAVDIERQVGTRIEVQLRAEQRRERVHR